MGPRVASRGPLPLPRALRQIALAALVPAVVALQPAAPAADAVVLSGRTMGTTYHVTLAGSPAELSTQELQREIDTLLDRINGQMSTWREDSELSRFNRHASDEWFGVSPETAHVVMRGLEVAADSDGAFDPTVAPLVRLWGFGPGSPAEGPPDDDAIARTREAVGYGLVEVRLDPPALRKADPRVELDLSGIAKGYGVDAVAEHLARRGVPAYMVEIGGEVCARGTKSDGSLWRIGIERPDERTRAVYAAVPLADAALATSGDYRNFFVRDGRRLSHTIDPHTGRPVAHDLASVTVVAEDCTTADALATALTVLGPETGWQWATDRGIAAHLLIRRGDRLLARTTPAFQVQIGEPRPLEPPPPPRRPGWGTFLLAAAVFGVAIIGLALGVIFSNRRLRGTCGGLAGMRDEHGRPVCEACRNPAEECDEFRRRVAAEDVGESGPEAASANGNDHEGTSARRATGGA